MAWIESHQSLSKHRKLLKTSGRLSVDRHTIIGHLMDLWWWGLDNIPSDGFMGHITDDEIAIAADWSGNAEEFVYALIQAGFIDENPDGRWLHDWYDYAGKLLEQREKEKERSRNRRSTAKRPKVDQRLTEEKPPEVGRHRTVPNRTVPNLNTEREEAVKQIVSAYEETIGPMQGEPNQLMCLFDYMDKGMEVELIVTAIHKSSNADVPMKYADKILSNCLRKGILTVNDLVKQQPPASNKERPLYAQGSKGSTAKGQKDDRYSAFYQLFPDS